MFKSISVYMCNTCIYPYVFIELKALHTIVTGVTFLQVLQVLQGVTAQCNGITIIIIIIYIYVLQLSIYSPLHLFVRGNTCEEMRK